MESVIVRVELVMVHTMYLLGDGVEVGRWLSDMEIVSSMDHIWCECS